MYAYNYLHGSEKLFYFGIKPLLPAVTEKNMKWLFNEMLGTRFAVLLNM